MQSCFFCLVKVLTKYHPTLGRRNFLAYLKVAAANYLTDYLRQNKKYQLHTNDDDFLNSIQDETPEEIRNLSELGMDFRKHLDSKSCEILHRYYWDLSYKLEISQNMGISRAECNTMLHNAVNTMRGVYGVSKDPYQELEDLLA